MSVMLCVSSPMSRSPSSPSIFHHHLPGRGHAVILAAVCAPNLVGEADTLVRLSSLALPSPLLAALAFPSPILNASHSGRGAHPHATGYLASVADPRLLWCGASMRLPPALSHRGRAAVKRRVGAYRLTRPVPSCRSGTGPDSGRSRAESRSSSSREAACRLLRSREPPAARGTV